MSTIAAVIGRVLLALIFIVSGIEKVVRPAAAGALLTSIGLPANFALLVGAFEVIAGLLLAIGLMSRLTAAVLAVYVALTIAYFHNAFADPAQLGQALKSLAIIGGLLMVFAYGQMRWSYDHWRARDQVRKAELRAAHAEGVAEGATTAPRAVVAGDTPVVAKKRWGWF